jgi:hypothetical protein
MPNILDQFLSLARIKLLGLTLVFPYRKANLECAGLTALFCTFQLIESGIKPPQSKKVIHLVFCWISREGWSGRRGSNPRRSPWEGDILPLNYSRFMMTRTIRYLLLFVHNVASLSETERACP